jgi:hypothetical protein
VAAALRCASQWLNKGLYFKLQLDYVWVEQHGKWVRKQSTKGQTVQNHFFGGDMLTATEQLVSDIQHALKVGL